MEDNYHFDEDDYVLAYFNNLLYDAKCLKRRTTEDGQKLYFIHYMGWKTTWDEWVDEDKLLEINSTNLDHQQTLKENFEKSNQKLVKSKREKKTRTLKTRGRPKKKK